MLKITQMCQEYVKLHVNILFTFKTIQKFVKIYKYVLLYIVKIFIIFWFTCKSLCYDMLQATIIFKKNSSKNSVNKFSEQLR